MSPAKGLRYAAHDLRDFRAYKFVDKGFRTTPHMIPNSGYLGHLAGRGRVQVQGLAFRGWGLRFLRNGTSGDGLCTHKEPIGAKWSSC